MENPALREQEHRPSGIGSGFGFESGSGTRRSSSSGEDKKFACSHAGCEKRFTRAEHLHRHALNHTNGDHACPRCSAAFKRRDLLDRHMSRHRQKDLEAGGEGCGVLDTRKRAWKAPDGSVAERRPHPLERVPARRRRGASTNPTASALEPRPVTEKPHEAPLQLPTSPVSERETDDSIFQVADCSNCIDRFAIGHGQDQQHQYQNQHQHQQYQHQQVHPVPQFDLFLNSLVPAAYDTENPWHLWNEQPFQPDTASSFNMPYTTAGDYKWLFSVPRPIASDPAEQCISFEPMPYVNSLTSRSSNSITSTSINPGTLTALGSIGSGDSLDGCRLDSQHDREPPNNDIYPRQPNQQVQPASPRSVNSANSTHIPNMIMNTNMNSNMSSMNSRITINSNARSTSNRNNAMNMPTAQAQGPFVGDLASRDANTHYATNLAEMERPLSRLVSTGHLPIIDGVTHDRLLTVISNAKPCLPDNASSSLQEHSLLSQTAMQSYLDHYFLRFNVAYPIIHAASFNPSTAEPLLLLSVILLGATYATKDAHQVAVCIHDVIRPSVFAHEGFSARPALWTLQTILLVECFGKSRAGQKQHDMSHLFHGLLINLIRRSDCQSVRPDGPPPASRSQTAEQHARAVEQAWQRWAEAEQKKRLALYCFMWDTQHAVLFCQSLCMSAFELRLNFPCNQHVWEAEDASAWEKAWWATTPPMPTPTPMPTPIRGETGHKVPLQPFYLPTLRAYLTPNGPPAPPELNLHGRMLVLHGLMSIFWDMQRRDQTSLGASVVSVPGATNWRQMISAAYENWKRDFDDFCSVKLAQIQQQPDLAREISAYASAANAVYHAAQCLLRMEFLDIQIYAGARSILGRPVQQRDYLRSAQVVKSWASAAAAADPGDDDGTPMTDRSQTPSTAAVVSSASRSAIVGGSDATGAVWHAARMIRDVMPDADSDAMSSLFHVPWCLYLATLTCWAFYHASPKGGLYDTDVDDRGGFDDDIHSSGEMDTDEMVWDSRAEMQTLIAGMTASPDAPLRLGTRHRKTLTRRRTNGLVWVMADTLTKVRWGIVHAGVIVLRGLVPARLINQYEADE